MSTTERQSGGGEREALTPDERFQRFYRDRFGESRRGEHSLDCLESWLAGATDAEQSVYDLARDIATLRRELAAVTADAARLRGEARDWQERFMTAADDPDAALREAVVEAAMAWRQERADQGFIPNPNMMHIPSNRLWSACSALDSATKPLGEAGVVEDAAKRLRENVDGQIWSDTGQVWANGSDLRTVLDALDQAAAARKP